MICQSWQPVARATSMYWFSRMARTALRMIRALPAVPPMPRARITLPSPLPSMAIIVRSTTRPTISRPPSAPSGLLRITRSQDMRRRLAESDPRIEEAVDDIDHQVQHDDARGQEQVDALDDGIVTPGDGVEQELPHAGDDEDAFHDDRPPQEGRELEAHHGDHRDHGVLQDVAGDHERLGQALGPRGADVG